MGSKTQRSSFLPLSLTHRTLPRTPALGAFNAAALAGPPAKLAMSRSVALIAFHVGLLGGAGPQRYMGGSAPSRAR